MKSKLSMYTSSYFTKKNQTQAMICMLMTKYSTICNIFSNTLTLVSMFKFWIKLDSLRILIIFSRPITSKAMLTPRELLRVSEGGYHLK